MTAGLSPWMNSLSRWSASVTSSLVLRPSDELPHGFLEPSKLFNFSVLGFKLVSHEFSRKAFEVFDCDLPRRETESARSALSSSSPILITVCYALGSCLVPALRAFHSSFFLLINSMSASSEVTRAVSSSI